MTAVNLHEEQERLLRAASTAFARRAASTVYAGTALRQTLIALLAEAGLAEHASPPEATLHLLSGRIVLHGDGREWTLAAGDLVPIPPEPHSVTAVEDSVFVLTVLRETGN